MNKPTLDPRAKPTQDTKKTYHSPKLQDHGVIRELTLTVGAGGFDDGMGAYYSS